MTEEFFTLNITTPSGSLTRQIRSLRLNDRSGSFTVLRGHADFLTVLDPSPGYFRDQETREVFFAADGGIFTVRKGTAHLTTKEYFESDRPEELASITESSILLRERSEKSFFSLLQGMEKTFIEKTAAFMREQQ